VIGHRLFARASGNERSGDVERRRGGEDRAEGRDGAERKKKSDGLR